MPSDSAVAAQSLIHQHKPVLFRLLRLSSSALQCLAVPVQIAVHLVFFKW
jgi:hypothetical protein